ncbi:hypothetical protein TWF481_003653 [Arthrobotrys musiformis]|uniref:Alpha/beta hydrolase fold-3 domain-containing protein n=1 Tax=Arthrobotrys musiformis TaxID=47236 RepID=A0AAV9WH83_9PEZI
MYSAIASVRLPLSVFTVDTTGRKVLESRRYSPYRDNIYARVKRPDSAGYWVSCGSIQEKCQPKDCDFVILIIHGGGYVSGHPVILLPGYLRMSEIFSEHGLKVGLFAIEYTYAPTCAFPTQAHQAQASYEYLIRDCGIDPAKIVVMGESAGGHLAVSLMVLLAKTRQTVIGAPRLCLPPACLILISPWVDMAQQPEPKSENDTDFLNQRLLNEWSRLVFPDEDSETTRTYRNLSQGPPNDLGFSWKQILPETCWISAGGDELFLPGIQSFVEHAQGAGVSVGFEVAPGEGHSWSAVEVMFKPGRLLSLPIESDLEKGVKILPGISLVASKIVERMATTTKTGAVSEV